MFALGRKQDQQIWNHIQDSMNWIFPMIGCSSSWSPIVKREENWHPSMWLYTNRAKEQQLAGIWVKRIFLDAGLI